MAFLWSLSEESGKNGEFYMCFVLIFHIYNYLGQC